MGNKKSAGPGRPKKKDKKIKSSVAYNPKVFKKVQEMAKERKWSISSTTAHIVEQYFFGESV